MTQEFKTIWADAKAAAFAAAEAHEKTLDPDHNKRGFDCGFAWVDFKPATHPFIRYLKTIDRKEDYFRGDKHWKSGWNFPCSGYHNTQSISTHVAAALALAGVLQKHFPEAKIYPGSRLD